MRRLRVRVTMDEDSDARKGAELPFVLGLLSDLVGDRPQKPVADRRFIEVDLDNMGDVMANLKPRLLLRVPNLLTGDSSTELQVDLQFRSLADFEPAGIVCQVDGLRHLVAQRSEWCHSAQTGGTPGLNAQEILVAKTDRVLQRQLDLILHHPRLQQLEAAWRGLEFLLHSVERAKYAASREDVDAPVAVRVLAVSKRELLQDFRRSLDFDRSTLWQLVYESEFGSAGGEPFGVLLGDYGFANCPEDLTVLAWMSRLAGAAFAPFIAGASPSLLGSSSFRVVHRELDLAGFDGSDFLAWRNLRRSSESRFLGLTVPRILMRHPYTGRFERDAGFPYREDTAGPDSANFLWGNTVFAFGAVLVRAFAMTGWFADIQSFRGDPASGGLKDRGGVVPELPVYCFSTEAEALAPRPPTDVVIDENLEPVLCALGFLPLCVAPGRRNGVFHASPSLHQPQSYSDADRTASEKLGAGLQQVLCTSRFGHYLKGLGQRFLGAASRPEDVEKRLQQWISGYVNEDKTAKWEDKIRRPLRGAKIHVRESVEQPGVYQLDFRLSPHSHHAELQTQVQLSTQIMAGPSV
jgi:type VI secretion system protein ImpD